MAAYLVTGAAGFIGAKVCEHLIQDGHQVIGIDNLNNAYDLRLKHWRLNRLTSLPGLSFFKLDITDFQLLEDVVKQMPPLAGVIHLAARAGVRYSVEDPWTFLNTNTNGTLNLLEVSHRYGIQKFVLASTSSIYGANAPLPTPEDASSDKPLQPYAASKKGAEALCHAYHFLYDLDVTIFRYFTVYGPAGRPDMVMFRFLQWIAEGRTVHLNGDGEQSRGFTYVDDIARGTILGLKPLGYEIINLGGHETITINGMIKQLEIFLGRKASIEQHPFHKADMLSNWANIEKAKNILKWMPEITLNEGMRRMVEWYLQEREWTSQVLTP